MKSSFGWLAVVAALVGAGHVVAQKNRNSDPGS